MSTNAGRIHAETAGNPRPGGSICRFLGVTLDTRRQLLLRGDEDIRLRPRTYDVLVFLATHPGRLISKQELMDAVWSDVAVTDDSIVQCLMEIRRALGPAQDAIETVRGRGYLLDAAVGWSDEIGAPAEPPPPSAPASSDQTSAADRSLVRSKGSPVRSWAFAAGAFALIVSGLLVWRFGITESPGRAPSPAIRSLAVLP